jgi:hypothetical protein
VRRQQPAQERYRLLQARLVAGDREKDRLGLVGRELDTVRRNRGCKPGRSRVEDQPRAPRRSIQPMIAQRYLVGRNHLGRARAPAFPLDAAHLEQVREVAVEVKRKVEKNRVVGMIAQREALIGGAAP